ncbi:uracil-DNA glycosylase [Xanthobacter aminoxidans]|uniref:uracil-DNA glycosylase n=1 Tax=Xanthobacter aminoxidans TaxID=186280 RepID=UPI0020230259|nr:uracil-DNA glycosylase [Xanthobacter aminoxidans]MCL8380727.1 uracil-DNA glycosylase [Xanthobacter aminoxidans]
MSVTADRDFADWADILAFHWEAGVDVAIGEVPVDRFAESAAEPSRSRPPAPPVRDAGSTGAASGGPAGFAPSRPAPSRNQPARPAAPATPTLVTQPPDEAVMGAREAARAAASLDELKAILDGFEGCALKRTASRLVFADGNPAAKVMFVGEAPGRDEDQQGLPFVGRSGKLLDLMLASIGLDRTSAYIANVIPWRPPGNRTPTPQETAVCLPFIARQIELADPDILVCLGGPSAQALLGTTEGITRLRGRFMDYDTGTRTIRAIATFHPAYLLRTPLGKRFAWRDMLAVEALLAGKGGG